MDLMNISALLRGLDGSDPYEILRVSRDADDAAIIRARRAQLRRAHPDVAGGNAAQARRINIAADLLLDPDSRERYDLISSPASRPAVLRPTGSHPFVDPRPRPADRPAAAAPRQVRMPSVPRTVLLAGYLIRGAAVTAPIYLVGILLLHLTAVSADAGSPPLWFPLLLVVIWLATTIVTAVGLHRGWPGFLTVGWSLLVLVLLPIAVTYLGGLWFGLSSSGGFDALVLLSGVLRPIGYLAAGAPVVGMVLMLSGLVVATLPPARRFARDTAAARDRAEFPLLHDPAS
jgi:hypothetical protein